MAGEPSSRPSSSIGGSFQAGSSRRLAVRFETPLGRWLTFLPVLVPACWPAEDALDLLSMRRAWAAAAFCSLVMGGRPRRLMGLYRTVLVDCGWLACAPPTAGARASGGCAGRAAWLRRLLFGGAAGEEAVAAAGWIALLGVYGTAAGAEASVGACAGTESGATTAAAGACGAAAGAAAAWAESRGVVAACAAGMGTGTGAEAGAEAGAGSWAEAGTAVDGASAAGAGRLPSASAWRGAAAGAWPTSMLHPETMQQEERAGVGCARASSRAWHQGGGSGVNQSVPANANSLPPPPLSPAVSVP